MKKIIAIIATFATVFSLASCSVKNQKTTAELVSEAEVEKSQLIESSIKAEEERSEGVVESIDKIGKTKKNEQIVIERPYDAGEHYQVYVFNRKGICQKIIDYYYYDDIKTFELKNEKQKVVGTQKKIDSDPKTRMVAFESEYEIEERNGFDQIYEFFVNEVALGSNIIIVE